MRPVFGAKIFGDKKQEAQRAIIGHVMHYVSKFVH